MKYFGTATDNWDLENSTYYKIVSDISEFGAITVGETQKWGNVEAKEGTYTYGKGDDIANLAKKNGQLLKCHNLIWHLNLPDWITYGNWTWQTLVPVMRNHIWNEVTHYKGRCYSWDVVNEPLIGDGSYRENIWWTIIGPEYIPIAYETAAAADPSAKLYLNDWGIEQPGPKFSAMANLIKSLQARGIKIDGVGLQAHFVVGYTPSQSDQIAALNSFAALGIDIAYTEMDIRFLTPPTSMDGLIQQGQDYCNSVAACVAARCVGVTLWDFTDKYTWIDYFFKPGPGLPCPWDKDLHKKQYAYGGIVNALK